MPGRAALALIILIAPALAAAHTDSSLGSVTLRGVPFVRQKPDFCGEACVAMALQRLGHRVSQDQVFAATGVAPRLGRGALAKDLLRGVKRLGFVPGKIWHRVPRRRPGPALATQLRALHADLAAGVPSIVCTRFDRSPGAPQHFRLVVGFDSATDEVIYHDPALDHGASQRMKRAELLHLWRLPQPGRPHDILVRIPLRPGTIKVPEADGAASHSPADYAQHVMRLQPTFRRLGGRFAVEIEPPFVVVGDGGRAAVRYHARGLIRWSVGELKQRYFARDPQKIITIWLFRGRRSYLRASKTLTGQAPGTPFGFYSPGLRALLMNISTGGGTLVHEIVHPLMEANFPACPPWFNEGMGSLYEGVGRRNHRIWGYINWRLPALQRAIRAGGVPSFPWLMRQTEHQFYAQDPGTNYAQSRYLVYYLQDRGLLRAYYHRFVKNHKQDPTGLATLKQVLGVEDIAAFKRRWQRYVLGLRYVRPAVK
jgi:hypothetical protein